MTRPTWLGPDISPLQAAIVEAARDRIGICEDPLGSNSSPEIDAMMDEFGIPRHQPWCAAFTGAVFHACGAAVPSTGPFISSCDQWLVWAKKEQRFTTTPTPGAAVLYGKGDDAQHIGIVARVTPMVLTIEGNRGFGTATREGLAVDLGPVAAGWVLGYVTPRPA